MKVVVAISLIMVVVEGFTVPKVLEELIGVPSGICPWLIVAMPFELCVRSAVIVDVPPAGMPVGEAFKVSTIQGSASLVFILPAV